MAASPPDEDSEEANELTLEQQSIETITASMEEATLDGDTSTVDQASTAASLPATTGFLGIPTNQYP
jgi:hypothetical protein